MLVDLGRNDIGRVAKFGTVRVEELMVIEKYSHVLRTSFPAGTLTGAPKVRTMQIIEELEPVKRGFYGGGIGYFSYSGNMDTCITIRTALVKGDQIYIQAAAGIVYTRAALRLDSLSPLPRGEGVPACGVERSDKNPVPRRRRHLTSPSSALHSYFRRM